ncbi:hypothetical protein FRC14_004625 [Serendipita sp. 396]|nr:hypothetical protein FRC14_004625 [Serendipita sp. 396]KAG8779147.1 hypothetical protein FRC15_010337 [Serendipita sp. 397]KAG8800356.1 hypothetical protein FRC16_003071 [Serendipita sp. 398]KAG8865904.1 hypothetical protein FRC20_009309 [Serendipita sp. 405]
MAWRTKRHTNPFDSQVPTRSVNSLRAEPHDVDTDTEKQSGGRSIELSHDNERMSIFNQYFERNGVLHFAELHNKGFQEAIDPEPLQDTKPSFRLLSSPVAIVLHRPQVIPRRPSPEVQDSTEHRRERRARAREAAVDLSTLGTSLPSRKLKNAPVDCLITSSRSRPPVAVVSPDLIEASNYAGPPVIQVHAQGVAKKQKRRRIRVKKKLPRPPAAFWRPSTHMGPRATGYALGYAGSWMVDDPSKARYQRDCMKKGRTMEENATFAKQLPHRPRKPQRSVTT